MRDGYRNDCKVCNLDAKHKRYAANPGPTIKRAQEWREANPERYRETQRRIRESPERKAREREGHLRRKYGITQADYEALLADQGGGCAVCGKPPGKISLHVDHEHATGRVRGLVCFKCNNALGDFDDDASRLRRGAAYLERDDADRALDEVIRARVRALVSAAP